MRTLTPTTFPTAPENQSKIFPSARKIHLVWARRRNSEPTPTEFSKSDHVSKVPAQMILSRNPGYDFSSGNKSLDFQTPAEQAKKASTV